MLTNERIRELWENYSPTQGIESFARSVEAEVRKQNDALIQQLVAARERGECATACDAIYHQFIGPAFGEVRHGVAACAAAIRERGRP